MKKWMGRLKWQKITRMLLMLVIAATLLALSLAVAINIPYVQTLLANKFVTEIRKKTGTGITLQSVKIAFPNTVRIREVYVQDKNRDTLLYLKSLNANIGLWKLLQSQLLLNSVEFDDVVVHIARREKEEDFNYQFFLDQFVKDGETTSSPDKPGKIWIFDLKDLTFNKFHCTFLDHLKGVDTEVKLDKFQVSADNFDLSKHLLKFSKLMLKDAVVRVALSEHVTAPKYKRIVNESVDARLIPGSDSIKVSSFPSWDISADEIRIENSDIRYDNQDVPRKGEGIDYNHLALKKFHGDLKDVLISKEGIIASVEALNFEEGCGFSLKKLAAEVQYRKDFAEVRNLQLTTPLSEISGNAKLEYSAFEKLITDFASCNLSLDIERIKLSSGDLLLFVPDLSKNQIFQKSDFSELVASAEVTGKISDLHIGKLELSFLQKTILKARGRIEGIPDYKKIEFDLSVDQLSSCKEDLLKFIEPSKFFGYKLPEAFGLTGTTSGNAGSFLATADLTTSFGNLSADIRYHDQGNAKGDSFKVVLDMKEIQVGKIIGDSLTGKFSASAVVTGCGILHGPFSCSAGMNIREAVYNSYKYSDIQVNSRIDNKKITASASSGDPNLKFKLTADADLNQPGKKMAASLELEMLNLNALNFTKRELSVQTSTTVNLQYSDSTSFMAGIESLHTKLKYDGKTIPLKVLKADASYSPEDFRIQIIGDMAEGTLSGNVRPEKLPGLLQNAYRRYLGQPVTVDEEGRIVTFRADFYQQENMIQHLVPGLDVLKIRKLEGSYKSSNNELNVELDVPEAMYHKLRIDSLRITAQGKNDSLALDLGMEKIYYDSLKINNLTIKEHIKRGKVHSEIKMTDSAGTARYLFANQIELDQGGYKIRFLPGGLILDGTKWDTADDNFFQKKNNLITTLNFNCKNKKESIEFIADDKTRKFIFSNFEIKNLFNILDYNGKKNILNGLADGEFGLSESGDAPEVHADFGISNLSLLDSLVGNLSCKLSTKNDQVDIDTKISNQQNAVALLGKVEHLSQNPTLDLLATIYLNNLSRIEKVSFGKLTQASGIITGKATIKGTQEKPEIEGDIRFEKTHFKISALNFLAKLNDEKIRISNKGFHFKDFVLEDSQSKKLTVNGEIFTDYKSEYTCDLRLETSDFHPVNSTAADNPIFFGKLALNTDIKLTGDLTSPKIEADIKINSSTDLTYVLPGSDLKLVSSEGIVKFRDSTHLNDSLLVKKQGDYLADSIISKIPGVDLSMNLEIDPDAKFRVDIDPKSGDYLAISGSSKLNISLDVSGKQSITGVYEVKSGNYQLSFYGMVKKNFTILPGSSVTWSGRPMDADVNITAGYVVRTSSVALVANETSGMSENEKNVFKTRLPYEVKLNIRGFLVKPEIKFELALPDKYLMTYPVVASKVALLNTEEKESELNKQVFALLVTGGFIADNPMGSGDGSSPTSVASTAARNSVNGILADQMNNISGRYISNVDVNFGLTSYEDYAGGTSDTRTELDIQLSKKMFNDRLTVEAQGSFDLSGDKKNTGTSTEKSTGEFGVVYQLTQSNEYKLRIYYQNIYDLFEGELTCSGIALIYEKEFDTLKKKRPVKKNTTTQ